MKSNVQILGTGSFLPSKDVSSSMLDYQTKNPDGTFYKKTGVNTRFYASDDDTIITMGVEAAKIAIDTAQIDKESLDVIIMANSVPYQPIPCSATFLQRELGLEKSKIPCLDVNATCLSHIAAMDQIIPSIQVGKYVNALIVSSEVASRGVNYEQLESSGLMGDGASATLLSKSLDSSYSKIMSTLFETDSSGIEFAQIEGGGSKVHPSHFNEDTEKFSFDMDGRKIYKLTSTIIDPFIERLFRDTGDSLDDVDVVIPHQASPQSLSLMTKKLGLEDKIIDISKDVGNQVSASLPFTLNYAIKNEKMKRGEKVLMIGTGAGLSLGGIYFRY